MEKIKDRPQDGPGANTLRGGLKTFNTKTVLYNWLEDSGGPQGYKPGFTTEEYLSESQRQQLGSRKIPLFGSGLPGVDSVLHPPEDKDIFQPSFGPGPQTWQSSTQSQLSGSIRDGISSPSKSKNDTGSNLSRKELELYRANWTHDTVESKKVRFMTEAKRMTQQMDKFREFIVRMPPGSSDVLRRMREQLLENQGVVALSRLKLALGTGIIHADDLNAVLSKLNIVFSRLEFAKILPFFTATYEMPAERVHRVFVASTSGFEGFEQPEYIFKRLFDRDRVPLADVSTSMSRDNAPETVAAIDEVLSAYVGWDGQFGHEEFTALLHDLFSSAPYQYENILHHLWGRK